MKPTVLVATTFRWFPTARLAIALANAGFNVKALCPSGHPLGTTGAVSEEFTYHGLAPIASFASAIPAAQPDIIIPGDDRATRHLHELYHRNQRPGTASEAIRAVIEQSLGSPESFDVVYSRTRFMDLAQKEGVRVPQTAVVANLEGLRKWIAATGLPTVLKSDGSTGGDGVKIAHTVEEAEHAFRSLSQPPNWMRAAKRAVIDHDTSLVWPCLLRRRPNVNAQQFIQGREATSTVACWKGVVLAALHFDVLSTVESRGHAAVLRLIEDAEMAAVTQKIARRLDLSGLYGFDFMRDAQTGIPYLIETNPRTTQVGHLALGSGRDLSAALYAAVTGEDVKARPPVTDSDTIALFPQEWIRDAASPFLRSAYHDVPWEAPELVLACVRRYGKQKSWYSRKAERGDSRELAAPGHECVSDGPPSAGWVAKQTKSRVP